MPHPMIKFLLGLLGIGDSPQYMPIHIWNELIAAHPEWKNMHDIADYMVDECGSTYGEAYSCMRKEWFSHDGKPVEQ